MPFVPASSMTSVSAGLPERRPEHDHLKEGSAGACLPEFQASSGPVATTCALGTRQDVLRTQWPWVAY